MAWRIKNCPVKHNGKFYPIGAVLKPEVAKKIPQHLVEEFAEKKPKQGGNRK